MVKVIQAKKYDAKHLEGTFLDDTSYDTMVDFDCDLYGPSLDGSMNEDNIVAKFRKNVFTEKEQQLCYEGLRNAATESQNRGKAAGPRGEKLGSANRGGRDWVTAFQLDVLEFLCRPENLLDDSETLDTIKARHKKLQEDTRGCVWLRSKVIPEQGEYEGWFDRWLEQVRDLPRADTRKKAIYVRDNYISDTNYAQSVMSGVAGYYGRYPRIPWGRASAYTEKNPELFAKSFPFLRKLNKEFKRLLPERWANQNREIQKLDKRFVIDETVFTTLTVNHNWRTAAHYDAGDLDAGFSNLTAVTDKGKGWRGAALVLPEFRVAVDLRPGDLLLVANHTALHGNLPLEGEENDRLSIVAYFREDMLNLKSYDYEALRRQFITERSKNKDHKFYRPLWNGVSPGWETSDEWAEYLKAHKMADEDRKVGTSSGLEDFFA
jgi:hypothetical protein